MVEKVEESDDFRMLPNQYYIREYDIMKNFAIECENDTMSERLLGELHRTRSYRHFRDAIHHMGIERQYYDFRYSYYLKIAKEWCELHNLKYDE